MFAGFKTLSFGAALAVLPAMLDYLGGVDMAAMGLDPRVSAGIGAAVMALRFFTNSPVLRR